MSEDPIETIMNDDCVTEVLEFSNLNDLLNACRVSTQFQRAARTIFTKKFKHLKLNVHLKTINEENLLVLFKNFGDLMESIDTPFVFQPRYNKDIQKFIIMLIRNYCSKSTRKLEYLKLNYFGNTNRYLQLMGNIFTNLKILHLEYVSMPYSVLQLINKLPEINELSLTYCIPILPISTRFEPTVNLNLQKLTLQSRNAIHLLDILRVIDKLYPNISELKFQIIGYVLQIKEFSNTLSNIGSLQKLKKLDIDIECEKLDILLSGLHMNRNQLEHLCVRFTEVTEYGINLLSEMKTLTELVILHTLSKNPISVTEMILNLPNLRFISIIDASITIKELNSIVKTLKNLSKAEFRMRNSIMDESMLHSIINTVENRKNKIPLWLVLHVNGINKVDEFEKYILENKYNITSLRINLTHKGINLLAP